MIFFLHSLITTLRENKRGGHLVVRCDKDLGKKREAISVFKDRQGCEKTRTFEGKDLLHDLQTEGSESAIKSGLSKNAKPLQ